MTIHPEFPNPEEGVDCYARELLRERRRHLETLESELQLVGMTPTDCQSCRRSLLQAIAELETLLRTGS